MTYLVTSALRKTTEMRRRLALNSLRALSSVSTSSRGHVDNSFAASNEAAARYFSSSPSGDGDNSIPANWLTEDGFTQFDTLHEMISRSTRVFADNELFGTYSAESNQFEWITFQDYEEKVHQCRSALKDLGASSEKHQQEEAETSCIMCCFTAFKHCILEQLLTLFPHLLL